MQKRKEWQLSALAAVALAALATGGIITLRAPHVPQRSAAAPRVASPLPSFGRADEAERYRQSVIDGNTRALQLLDQALAVARQRGNADAAYLRSLEHMRAERAARLVAFERR